jgi:hypothetical protein
MPMVVPMPALVPGSEAEAQFAQMFTFAHPPSTSYVTAITAIGRGDCGQTPCLNGGTCIVMPRLNFSGTMNATYRCRCLLNFTGTNCEQLQVGALGGGRRRAAENHASGLAVVTVHAQAQTPALAQRHLHEVQHIVHVHHLDPPALDLSGPGSRISPNYNGGHRRNLGSKLSESERDELERLRRENMDLREQLAVTCACPDTQSQSSTGSGNVEPINVSEAPTTPGSRRRQQSNQCSPNPCLNGGSCTNGATTSTCTCTAGWSGGTCTTPDLNTAITNRYQAPDGSMWGCVESPCAWHPCANGGTCQDEPLGRAINGNLSTGFRCVCAFQWAGPTCNQTRASGGWSYDVKPGLLWPCPYDSMPARDSRGICTTPYWLAHSGFRGCPDGVINNQDLQHMLSQMSTSLAQRGSRFEGYPVDADPVPMSVCTEECHLMASAFRIPPWNQSLPGITTTRDQCDSNCAFGNNLINVHDLLGLLAVYTTNYNTHPC